MNACLVIRATPPAVKVAGRVLFLSEEIVTTEDSEQILARIAPPQAHIAGNPARLTPLPAPADVDSGKNALCRRKPRTPSVFSC